MMLYWKQIPFMISDQTLIKGRTNFLDLLVADVSTHLAVYAGDH